MILSKKIRLEPNKTQRTAFAGHAGIARFTYNHFLDLSKKQYEETRFIPSAIDMHKTLVETIKVEHPWFYNYSKCSPQEALRNLETAYKNFHRKQKPSNYKLFKYKTINGVKVNQGLQGLPQFKKKFSNDSFYLETNGKMKVLDNKIKLPKIGWVKTSEIIDKDVLIKNVTISRVSNEWFVSFKYDITPVKSVKKEVSVGVDLGITTLATLSNGERFDNIKSYKNNKVKLRRLQKSLSRKYVAKAENQSKNYKKSKLKLSRLHQDIANARKDCTHKLTTYLAKNFDTVVIEDLKVKNMVKNHKLASAILDGGFYEFKRQLLYKKEYYRGSVILANTFFPSSKKCSCCKTVNKDLKLNDRVWTCSSCETKHDRDDNASKTLDSLKELVVSLTVSAFGDESTVGKPIQLVDELGMKHQMYTFV